MTNAVGATLPVEGSNDGHTFRLSAAIRGSGKIVGEAEFTDAPTWGEPWVRDVRAWSLPQALAKASELPLVAWTLPDDDADQAVVASAVQQVSIDRLHLELHRAATRTLVGDGYPLGAAAATTIAAQGLAAVLAILEAAGVQVRQS